MTSSEDLYLSSEEAFVTAGGHLHCLHCYSFVRCSQMDQEEQDGEVCPIITCPQDCGAVFHCCKEKEHLLLCPRVQAPCLNRHYGCQAVMRREQVNAHLERCPASVVVCMAEWNRWPVYSRERVGGRGTMRTKNPYATQGQLGTHTKCDAFPKQLLQCFTLFFQILIWHYETKGC